MHYDTFISPFFYIILTVYLGSEVLISFMRRIFQKESTVVADFNHLHSMLFIIFETKTKINPHISASLSINFVYFLSVLPSLFFMNNFELTRNYSIVLYLLFIILYFVVSKIYKKVIKF